MQTWGSDATNLLVGYATKVKHANEDYPALEYRVAKITQCGSGLQE